MVLGKLAENSFALSKISESGAYLIGAVWLLPDAAGTRPLQLQHGLGFFRGGGASNVGRLGCGSKDCLPG